MDLILTDILVKGSMFTAFVLVLGCLLQRNLVTTEGHRGTNCLIFYAVQMDGGTRAAKALAEQHGLEFVQRVSACLKSLCYSNLRACNLHFLNLHSKISFILFYLRAANELTSISYLRDI